MKWYRQVSRFLFFLIAAFICFGCATQTIRRNDFPDFITANEDYYVTRIGDVPEIDGESYRLEIKGLIKNPQSFTVDELYSMEMEELPLTVECIGNSPQGPLLSTAIWKGFRLYDLLMSLGIEEGATGVAYRAADGYYASHTLEQLKDNGIIGALYMNGEVLPQRQGFPIRFLNPGYHGVKQPAWVTEIEIIDRPIQDYWEDRGWDCSPPMAIDSTIFFPKNNVKVKPGGSLLIGGAAFGGTRVTGVELSFDRGTTWEQAHITESLDADNIWVFWQIDLVFPETGNYSVNVRARDINGVIQEEKDPDKYDGQNDWPVLKVKVVE
jgi:DMSO/TMAO reductase YedYZ molybdopterin-dependent catalytic subunit